MTLETRIRDAFERHANDVRQTGADGWPSIERRIERSHRIRMIGSTAGAVLVIAAALVAIPRLGGRSLEPVTPPISAPSAIPQLVTRIPVRAVALAAGEEALWALTSGERVGDRGTLHRIDPAKNGVTARIRVGMNPIAVAVGGGSVWVLNGEGCGSTRPCEPGVAPASAEAAEERSVWRIDAETLEIVDRMQVGTRYDLAYGISHAWAAVPGAEGLVRIEGSSSPDNAYRPWGSVAGAGRVRLAVGEGLAWVVSEAADSDDRRPLLSVIDLSRRELVETIDIAGHGTAPDVAVGFGSAWVTTGTDASASGLMRIDPATRQIAARISLPDAAPVGLTSVTTGYGYVWATSGRGYLWKIDPTTNSAPIEPLLVGSAPPVPTNAVVAGFGSIWVAADDGEIWRFDP